MPPEQGQPVHRARLFWGALHTQVVLLSRAYAALPHRCQRSLTKVGAGVATHRG